MDCPKGHLSPLMNLLGLSQFGGWSNCLVRGKRRLFSYLKDLSPGILSSPSPKEIGPACESS